MGDAGRHQQAAVLEMANGLLGGHELAAQEIGRGVARDLQDHLGLGLVEPDAVLGVEPRVLRRIELEALGRDQQRADAAEGEALERAAVERHQVPDAGVVDQPVGVQRLVGLLALGLAVAKADELALAGGRLDLPEALLLFGVERLVVVAAHLQHRLQAAVEQLAHEGVVEDRIQAAQAGESGKSLQIGQRQLAEVLRRHPVAAVLGAFDQVAQLAEALGQIALDGAPAHGELLREIGRMQRVTLVELEKDVRQPVGQRVAVGTTSCHEVGSLTVDRTADACSCLPISRVLLFVFSRSRE